MDTGKQKTFPTNDADQMQSAWSYTCWISECIRMKIGAYLLPCTKKSKWIKDLNIKLLNILNEIKEKVENSFECISTVDIFLNRTLIAQMQRLTISKCDLHKTENFWKTKDTINRTNDSLQNGKIFLSTPHLIEG